MATISRIGKCTFTSVMNCEYVKHTKISYEEIYDDRFFHSYFL